MRRFELKEGTSSKFWEITVAGKTHTVRFGRLGTEGQTKTKKLSTPAAASADAEKLVREKLAKGYSEVGAAKRPKRAHSDLDRILVAFDELSKKDVVTGGPVGTTPSAAWEDIRSMAENDLGEDVKDFSAVFWHGDAHGAFGEEGELTSSLALHWQGDRDLIAKALKKTGLRVTVPKDDRATFRLEPRKEALAKTKKAGDLVPASEVRVGDVIDLDRDGKRWRVVAVRKNKDRTLSVFVEAGGFRFWSGQPADKLRVVKRAKA